jgi:chloramphenicol 3-O-phosphotransferase
MREQTSPVFLITGAPGSGKTTVATALMRRFPFGLHIPVDDLREWVVSGIAHPVPAWTNETTRQFRLARQAAAQVAALYAAAGFAVAIDDVIFPGEAQALLAASLAGFEVHKVLLQPGLDVALARNAERTNKNFDTSLLAEVTRTVHHALAGQDFAGSGWIVIDSSHWSVEETVDEILRRT